MLDKLNETYSRKYDVKYDESGSGGDGGKKVLKSSQFASRNQIKLLSHDLFVVACVASLLGNIPRNND